MKESPGHVDGRGDHDAPEPTQPLPRWPPAAPTEPPLLYPRREMCGTTHAGSRNHDRCESGRNLSRSVRPECFAAKRIEGPVPSAASRCIEGLAAPPCRGCPSIHRSFAVRHAGRADSCARPASCASHERPQQRHRWTGDEHRNPGQRLGLPPRRPNFTAVSYTHLTLPTICSV